MKCIKTYPDLSASRIEDTLCDLSARDDIGLEHLPGERLRQWKRDPDAVVYDTEVGIDRGHIFGCDILDSSCPAPKVLQRFVCQWRSTRHLACVG